jgi:hypothetical protein
MLGQVTVVHTLTMHCNITFSTHRASTGNKPPLLYKDEQVTAICYEDLEGRMQSFLILKQAVNIVTTLLFNLKAGGQYSYHCAV